MGRSGSKKSLKKTVVARGTFGREFVVIPGLINKQAVEVFTYGQCHALALEIHKETGWEIAAFVDKDNDFYHIFNISDQKEIVDIFGRNKVSKYREVSPLIDDDFRGIVRNLDPKIVASYGPRNDWLKPDLELAKKFVQAVIKN
jgi:hypothetical protein